MSGHGDDSMNFLPKNASEQQRRSPSDVNNRGEFSVSKKCTRFFQNKDFYGFLVGFSWKQKDPDQWCYEIFYEWNAPCKQLEIKESSGNWREKLFSSNSEKYKKVSVLGEILSFLNQDEPGFRSTKGRGWTLFVFIFSTWLLKCFKCFGKWIISKDNWQ